MDKKEINQWMTQVEEYLRGLGAEDSTYLRYQLVVHTIMGPLHISIWPDALMCRFEDVDKAKEAMGANRSALGLHRVNPFSGKYNIHFPEDHSVEQKMDYIREWHVPKRWIPTPEA